MVPRPGPARTEGTALPPDAHRARRVSSLAPLFLPALAAALLCLSWQRWSSPLYDVGRELYTAWSISEGARLYQDIWLPRGPLSSYWNGLVFDVFGASMSTLAITNLLILALGTLLLHRAIQREYGRGTALLASFFLLSVFAFARYSKQGNYNFIMPYAHEVTHGLVLSLVVMALLLRALGGEPGAAGDEPDAAGGEPEAAEATPNTQRRAGAWLLSAGFALGLVLLTKQEIAVAATVATVVTVATQSALSLRHRTEQLGLVALGAALPLAISLLLLGTAPFVMMWNPSIGDVVRENPFYQANLGLDHPARSLGRMGLATLVLGGELLLIAGIGRRLVGANPARIATATVAFLALHLALLAFGPVPATRIWARAPGMLPAFVAVVGLSCIAARVASPGRGAARAFLCWLAIFAAFMLLKLGLNPRIYHYGFSQALPAAMLFVVVCVGILPGWLSKLRVDERFVRSALASLMVCFCLYSLLLEVAAYRNLQVSTGENADRFYGPPADAHYRHVMELLDQHIEPGKTLAVLPEGVLFNYLLRIRNPTPHISFLPFEFTLTGEERIVEDFASSPPDYVLLMPRNVTEYGFREFGEAGYGDGIMSWLRDKYLWPEGVHPGQVKLLRRRERAAGAEQP